jgi:hypothetical protein
MRFLPMCALAATIALSSGVEAAGWQMQPGSTPLLTYGAGDPVSYRFECAAGGVIVTETGVTKLMNLKTGTQIGDDAQATMPDGSAMMALFGGKGEPDFVPAQAAKNPAGGWDLTIRLAKDDKQLKGVSKSEMISLFTTGYTMAIVMDDNARAKWNDFMRRCRTRA